MQWVSLLDNYGEEGRAEFQLKWYRFQWKNERFILCSQASNEIQSQMQTLPQIMSWLYPYLLEKIRTFWNWNKFPLVQMLAFFPPTEKWWSYNNIYHTSGNSWTLFNFGDPGASTGVWWAGNIYLAVAIGGLHLLSFLTQTLLIFWQQRSPLGVQMMGCNARLLMRFPTTILDTLLFALHSL